MKFRVLSDSSCDITKEQEERYHIGIIPYYVSMDGVHYKKDRVEITAEEFYREMAENPGVYPKTSTPTQVDLYHFFLPYAKAGEQVLYFNLTAKFSSSYQSITLIAEELMEEYPACKIIVVDSYSATVQEGLLVTEAARMAEDGLTLGRTFCVWSTDAGVDKKCSGRSLQFSMPGRRLVGIKQS